MENLNKLKNAYSQNGKNFVGNKLSWADIFVFYSLGALVKAVPEVKGQFGDQFKPLMDEIYANENLKKYLENRPEVDF